MEWANYVSRGLSLRDGLLCRNLTAAHNGEMIVREAFHVYESEMLVYGVDTVRTLRKAMEQAHVDSRVRKAIATVVFKTLNRIPPLKQRAILGNDQMR